MVVALVFCIMGFVPKSAVGVFKSTKDSLGTPNHPSVKKKNLQKTSTAINSEREKKTLSTEVSSLAKCSSFRHYPDSQVNKFIFKTTIDGFL